MCKQFLFVIKTTVIVRFGLNFEEKKNRRPARKIEFVSLLTADGELKIKIICWTFGAFRNNSINIEFGL